MKDESGDIIRFIAVQEDITSIKIALEKIDELNKLQDLILRSIPSGILIFDLKGKIHYVNPEMINMSHYNEFELKTTNFLELVDSAGLISLIVKKIEQDNLSNVETELNLVPKRGEPFPIKLNIAELFKHERYLAVIRDIRLEKRNEQLIEEFQKLINQETYLSLFKQSRIGPEIYLTDELSFTKEDKNIVATKVGVYYSTAIGQGAAARLGLFGPLPFPDNPNYESIVFSTFIKDENNSDPRAKGISYCLFVVTFPHQYEPYYANRQYLTSIFEKFVAGCEDIKKITKESLNDLKLALIT